MVFDSVVSPAFKDAGDVGPLVCLVAIEQVEDPLFFAGPGRTSLDHRVQVVVPALPALLADATRQMVGNFGPKMRSVYADQVQKKSVLDVSPGSLYQVGVEYLLPPMQALHIGPPLQRLSNLLPVLAAIDPDSLLELLVLLLGPVPLDFAAQAVDVLGLLVLGWPSLVELRVLLLVADQVSLGFAVAQVIYVLREPVGLVHRSEGAGVAAGCVHQRVLFERGASEEEGVGG